MSEQPSSPATAGVDEVRARQLLADMEAVVQRNPAAKTEEIVRVICAAFEGVRVQEKQACANVAVTCVPGDIDADALPRVIAAAIRSRSNEGGNE